MAAERAAATSNSSQGPGTGAFHRLVRTLSGKGGSQSAPQPISPTLSSGTVPPSISETLEAPALNLPTDSGPKAPSTPQKDLFSGVIDRLKNLSFGSGKSSGDEARKARDALNGVYPIIEASTFLETPPEPTAVEAEPFPTDPHVDVAATEDPAEPTYLARKIQSLIDALPLPLPSSPRTPAPPKQQPKPPARDRAGKPVPPPGATPIKDSKLIAMLSSATIMNGGHVGERERRVSVWSVLDSLGSQRGDDGNDADDGPGGGEGEGDGSGSGSGSGDGGSVFQDTSGIMMYSPLFPTNDSLVEIAESGVVTPTTPAEEVSSAAAQLAGWMGMWPFSMWGAASTSTSTSAPTAATPSPVPGVTALPTSPPGSPYRPSSPRNPRMRIQGQRVWVPSTTKLSLQAMWWGYRLYLPPPVLDILDDKQLEATKRATLITTALTWFFSHIPLTALPPAVRPALLLLQTLIPYVGYIGTFVSWSWGTIKSYDTGHGVILTATWLLPVALIPGTWEERDFPPASPPEQAPTPLPPTASPPPASPAPAPVPVPPISSPASPAPVPVPAPTPPSPQVPAQSPGPASPFSPSAHPLPSPPPSPQYPPQSPPRALGLVLAGPSDPLPLWVPPPPPPSPPKIPLPDIGEEDDEVSPSQSPRFGLGVLRGVGKAKAKAKGERKIEGEDNTKQTEKEKGRARARLKAIVSAPFAGKSG